jgi:hypothetical protein
VKSWIHQARTETLLGKSWIQQAREQARIQDPRSKIPRDSSWEILDPASQDPRSKIQDAQRLFLGNLGSTDPRFLGQDPREILDPGSWIQQAPLDPRFLGQDLEEILDLGSWIHEDEMVRLEKDKSLHLSDLKRETWLSTNIPETWYNCIIYSLYLYVGLKR